MFNLNPPLSLLRPAHSHLSLHSSPVHSNLSSTSSPPSVPLAPSRAALFRRARRPRADIWLWFTLGRAGGGLTAAPLQDKLFGFAWTSDLRLSRPARSHGERRDARLSPPTRWEDAGQYGRKTCSISDSDVLKTVERTSENIHTPLKSKAECGRLGEERSDTRW